MSAVIDYKILVKELVRRLPLILLSAILFAAASWAGYHLFVTPLYRSTATMYVNNRSQSSSLEDITSISSADITAAVKLVDTCEAIILNEDILQQALSEAGVEKNIRELQDHLTVSSINDTQVFTISLTDSSADDAAEIVNAITEVVTERFPEIVDGGSVNLISGAKIAENIYSPKYVNKTIRGAVIGLLFGCLLVIIMALTDNQIRNEKDFEQWDYPVLAVIPDIGRAELKEKKAYRK